MKSRSASRSSTRVVVLVGSLVKALISPAVRGVSLRAITLNACQSTTLSPRERAMRSLVSTDPALSSWNSSKMRAVVAAFFDTTAQAPLLFPIWEYPVLRSEEHTSELQSRGHLVCRLLLEKKKTQ